MNDLKRAQRSRADAYSENERTSKAYNEARKQGASPAVLARLRKESDEAYAEYRAWVDAMTEASMAGAYDHDFYDYDD